MRVWRGEVTYLIINLPPRYSKTEIVVKLFTAWCYAKNPSCEFIHLSYSDLLAMDNSSAIKEIIQSQAFQQLWPIELTKESDGAWKTSAGGVFLARSSGGQVTGYGAGKVDDFRDGHGFGGCFPYWQTVNTDRGPMPIGEIVERGLNVRVESVNPATGAVEWKRIEKYWHNPPNDIIEVVLSDGSAFHCTPNHEIYTARGKVRADELLKTDVLVSAPRVVDRLDSSSGEFGGLLNRNSLVKSDPKLSRGEFPALFSFRRNEMLGVSSSCAATPNVSDCLRCYSILFSQIFRLFFAQENLLNIFHGKAGRPNSFTLFYRPVLMDDFRRGFDEVVGKILKPTISRVAVDVVNSRSLRERTDEGFKNKSGDAEFKLLAAIGKDDFKILSSDKMSFSDASFSRLNAVGEKDLSREAVHAPEVADSVRLLETDDRSPLFIRKICHVDKTYCLGIEDNHNFTVGKSRILVSNCMLIDDPNKPDDALSDIKRNAVNRRWDETLKSRLNSSRTPVIVIMQRLHEDDFCGMLLKDEEYKFERLILPAILDEGTDQERALWPEKHSLEQLKAMQKKNSYMFAGQMQQNPTPLGGGIIKSAWLGYYDVLPKIKYRAVFVDTAQKEKEANDYQVASLWGLGEDGKLYLIDLMREKFQAYELEVRIPAFWNKAKADKTSPLRFMGVEDKASGTQLIQNIRHKIRPAIPVKEIERSRSKLERVMDVQGYIESGYIMLPKNAAFLSDFIRECEAFTADDSHPHDDQIDTMVDAISLMLAKKFMLYSDVNWD